MRQALFTILAGASELLFMLPVVSVGLHPACPFEYAAASGGPARHSRALSMVSTRLTLAIIAGMPLGLLIGENFGWRATFLALRRWRPSRLSASSQGCRGNDRWPVILFALVSMLLSAGWRIAAHSSDT